MCKGVKYTKWSTFQTDWRMFKEFKPDFWKSFINEELNLSSSSNEVEEIEVKNEVMEIEVKPKIKKIRVVKPKKKLIIVEDDETA